MLGEYMKKAVAGLAAVMAIGMAGCGQSILHEDVVVGITPAEIEAAEAAQAIYDYMMNEFDAIVEAGEEYNPEVHDRIVLEKAAERFFLPIEEVDRIFAQYAGKKSQK